MGNVIPKPWTIEDFLAWERAQEERYEFVDGIVIMMVGGTIDHTTIKGNIYAALYRRLARSGCRVFVAGPKVVTRSSVTYPDVVVTCAKDLAPKADTVAEPVLVVEVLSRSTESVDRGRKWQGYQGIASLRYFILVSQDEPRVEIYGRTEPGWGYSVLTRLGDVVALPELEASLPLRAIYRDVAVGRRRSG
jgi:Uma2 family endonuclease